MPAGDKRSRLASDAAGLAKELGLMDKLKDWSDEEISGLDMEAALALGMPPAKAARLCCRIRAVGREDARTRELNSQLWASARKGKQAVQGLLLTRHESLVGEVDRLLREGAEINSADAFGDTALHAACENAHADIVARLLRGGADVMVKNTKGKAPACLKFQPLIAVAEDGPEETTHSLLQRGANVKEVNDKGHTALHLAAKSGRNQIVSLLHEKGCPLDERDYRGRTPLHFAASEGHPEITKILLDKGANVNAKTQAGTTALHWVAVLGNQKLAKVLIDAGADINSRNNDGYTPLDRATDEGMQKLLQQRGGISSLGFWSLRS